MKNMEDALKRRREIRKRKILQNANERLKRVSTIHGETTQRQPSKNKEENIHEGNIHEGNIYEENQKEILIHEENNQKKIIYEGDSNVDQNDGRDVNGIIKGLNPLQEENIQETGMGNAQTPMIRTNSRLRITLMIIFALLCFYQSTYWPLITKITGLGEIHQQSFLLPFCLLELFFFFIPSLRKVGPGQKVNLFILMLKLCGVSTAVLEKLQFIILEIHEFFTDLVIFIFILVVLQNMNDLL